MNEISSDVLINILEFLPLDSLKLHDLRFVSKIFNEACSSEYLRKSKSFDTFRSLFPSTTFPLRDIGELDPAEMMETPICEKVFKTYFPYIPPEHREVYKCDDPPEVALEKMKTRLSDVCYQRLRDFIPAHKEYDKAGGIVDFTVFRLHDYIPLVQSEIEKVENRKEAKLPVFIHKLAVVKFFEKFPEIVEKREVERENEIIKAIEEGRKLKSYRFIDAIVLDEDEKDSIETVDLGKIDEPISTKGAIVEEEGDKECSFWPERYVQRDGGNRFFKPLHISDLMALCCNPPYSISNGENKPLKCETVIRETLWDNFKNLSDYEILVWANMKSRWASEFEGGVDYWGNYLVSYYVKSLNVVIVGYGNSTD